MWGMTAEGAEVSWAVGTAGPSLLEAFLQLSPDAAVVVDAAGQIRAVNQLALGMFGYRPGELDGQPIELLVPERLRDAHVRQRSGYLAAPRTRPMGGPELDLRARRKDATEFPVDISLAPLSSGGSEPLVVAAIRDVTELRHRERLAARLAAVVQASDAAILSTLPDRTVDSWNPAAERLFGYPAEEMIGQPLDRLIPDDEQAEFERAYAEFAGTEQAALRDSWLLRKDGERIPVAVTISAMTDQHGSVIGYCEVLRDMTERRRQQAELAAALADRQLLSERDRIARGLHDVVIHRIFAAGIAVQSAETLVGEPAARQRLDKAVEELETATREIRRHIFAIQEPLAPLAPLAPVAPLAAEPPPA